MIITKKLHIGVDVGGVLIKKSSRGRKGNLSEDTEFDDDNVQWIDDSVRVLTELNKSFTISIISFCGIEREVSTRKVLSSISHIVPEERWFFTRSRKEKAKICNDNKINVMIDDTQEVMDILKSNCPGIKLIWFCPPMKTRNKKMYLVQSWNEIENLLIHHE